MKRRPVTIQRQWTAALLAVTLLAVLPLSAAAHGPKGHGGEGPTPLAITEKGIALFNQLIEKGKLDDTWEANFAGATVTTRMADGKMEYVVRLARAKADPEAVYIFFDAKGDYSGSNFTGK